jgi:PD-(D/E)XK nuclease superfamily
MSKHLRIVTNSELTCFRRCQREHHFAYELGYRSTADAEALRIGTLVHAGLELWWKGYPLAAVLFESTQGAMDEYEAAKLRVMLRGYDARWGCERANFEVRGVECEFRAPLVNPSTGAPSRTFELGGKVDVLLAKGFVEHKTTSREIGVGSVYWRRLQMDSQVSTYYAGARSLGTEPELCVYDVLRKPGQRPSQVPLKDDDGCKIVLDQAGERVRTKDGKKWRQTGDAELGYVLQTRPETAEEYELRLTEEVAENPDKYFQRGEVVRLDQEEKDAALDAWQLTRAMREAELLGAHPRNADACERFGGLCPFFSVCTGTASLDDPSQFVRVANVHQELSVEAAE